MAQTTSSLFDSNTNDYLTAEDLGISEEQYAEYVAESAECSQVEGHIRLRGGRKVYAA